MPLLLPSEPLRRPARDSTSPVSPKFATGVKALDRLLSGGFPQGEICEIVGPLSSGKTGLLIKILSETTRRGERVAYVDPFHTFDPLTASQAGVVLSRFLWIRSRAGSNQERLHQAFKAIDILARSESFCLVALDLESPRPAAQSNSRKIPYPTWFRIKKTLQGKPISVLVLNTQPAAGSAAALVLGLERQFVKWKVSGRQSHLEQPGHARLLRGLCSEVRLLRGKRHGRITLHSAV